MSNRDALRKLSKRLPGADETDAIIKGLSKESDRVAAIVGASLVESVLEHLLISSFVSKRSDLMPRLFENRGPLSDFNSKILVAEAFGVLNSSGAEELQRIRHIRNCFAHARLPVSFDTPEISKEVHDFIILITMNGVMNERLQQNDFTNMSNKRAYVLICHLVIIFLEGRKFNLGGKRLISR